MVTQEFAKIKLTQVSEHTNNINVTQMLLREAEKTTACHASI